MEQFNLDKWLQDKSRKVTTRYSNREVRIICTDRKAKLPIVALMVDMDGNEYVTYHTKNGWCDETEKYPDKRDLFFANEEEELTELQKTLEEDCDCYVDLYNDGKTREELRMWIKAWCPRIIDLARKELQPEIDKELDEAYKSRDEVVYLEGYDQGKEDTLKDLLKWKKATEDKDFDRHVLLLEDDRVVIASCVYKDEYYIELDDLKTLPKE